MKVWDENRVELQLREIELVKDLVILSGGFAWHLMSPPHIEYRMLHDHKDLDYFVKPENFAALIERLKANGYEKFWSKYDNITPNFIRYAAFRPEKVLLDIFIDDVPSIEVKGIHVVEPSKLLSFYGEIHSSTHCQAVAAAVKIVAKGESPVDRPELVKGYETA